MQHVTTPLSDMRTIMWIAIVTLSSVLFSLAFACATPFAALAAVAGSTMHRRDALALVGTAWIANQAVGFLLLGYPQTFETFAWGITIGLAALCATLIAREIASRVKTRSVSAVVTFAGAFITYEIGLYSATALLASDNVAFGLPVVLRILEINGFAFAGLLSLNLLALAVGVLPQRSRLLFSPRA